MTQDNAGQDGLNFTIDTNNLYKEEAFTDFKIGSVQMLSPVLVDGSPDESREKIFLGRTQLNTPQGPIPIQAKLEGDTLETAIKSFPAAMEVETQKVVASLKRLQEQQQKSKDSRIIMPGMTN